MWLLPPSVTQRADLTGISIPQYSHIQNENDGGSHQGVNPGQRMRYRMPVWEASTRNVASTQKHHSINHYYYLFYKLVFIPNVAACCSVCNVCVYTYVCVPVCVHVCAHV